MPDVQIPSTSMFEFRMSLACLPAGANDQSVKVSFTTFMPGICSLAPPLTLWTRTSETLPLARACAFTEQIISSRQPLPTRVLLTPILYFLPPPWAVELPPLSSSSPQPAATTASRPTSSISSAMGRARRLMGTNTLLVRWDMSSGALQHPCRTAGMLRVRRVEEPARLVGAHHRRAGEHRGQRRAFDEPRRRADLHFVRERHCGDRA